MGASYPHKIWKQDIIDHLHRQGRPNRAEGQYNYVVEHLQREGFIEISQPVNISVADIHSDTRTMTLLSEGRNFYLKGGYQAAHRKEQKEVRFKTTYLIRTTDYIRPILGSISGSIHTSITNHGMRTRNLKSGSKH